MIAQAPRWLVLLALAFAVRAIALGNPVLHVDEEFYFLVGQRWAEGALPYVDIWDRKPVGLFLIYLLPGALGLPGGIWLYQLLALGCAVGTALIVASLADRAGWQRGALFGAAAYLLWINLIEGQGGQSPIFYNLLIAGATWLIAPRGNDAASPGRRIRYGLAAMALVGVALQIKTSVVFEGMFFGLWLLWRERQRPLWHVAGYAAVLVALALLPTAIAWGSYRAIGHEAEWVFANITSILQRVPDPPGERFGNLAKLLLITSPMLAMAVLARAVRPGATAERATADWLFGWGAVAVAAVLGFGTWFDHYALPMLVPLSVLAAGFLGHHRTGLRIAIPLLAFVAVGGQALLSVKRINRGGQAQAVALARAIGVGPGCLYVYSSTPMLYALADRCTLTRFQFPAHLPRRREAGALGVDEAAEIDRIFMARPGAVVMQPAYDGERPELRARVLGHLARGGYRRAAVLPLGNLKITVWKPATQATSDATPPSRASISD